MQKESSFMVIAATVTQKQNAGTNQIRGTGQQSLEDARELSGSQILCEALVREGVDLLYGYPGGAIMPFYDALTEYSTLRHVLVRHEQAAAHAADGYARATGKVGVCVATSGPAPPTWSLGSLPPTWTRPPSLPSLDR